MTWAFAWRVLVTWVVISLIFGLAWWGLAELTRWRRYRALKMRRTVWPKQWEED